MRIALISDDVFYAEGVEAYLSLYGIKVSSFSGFYNLKKTNFDLYIIAIESHYNRRNICNMLSHDINAMFIFDIPLSNKNTSKAGYFTKKSTCQELLVVIMSYNSGALKKGKVTDLDIIFLRMFIDQFKTIQEISRITEVSISDIYRVKMKLIKNFHPNTRHPKTLIYCSSLLFFYKI